MSLELSSICVVDVKANLNSAETRIRNMKIELALGVQTVHATITIAPCSGILSERDINSFRRRGKRRGGSFHRSMRDWSCWFLSRDNFVAKSIVQPGIGLFPE